MSQRGANLNPIVLAATIALLLLTAEAADAADPRAEMAAH